MYLNDLELRLNKKKTGLTLTWDVFKCAIYWW